MYLPSASAFLRIVSRYATAPADISLHVVFAQHAVDDNSRCNSPMPGNQRLPGIRFSRHAEGGIFFARAACMATPSLSWSAFGSGLDGDGITGAGKSMVSRMICFLLIAKSIAGVYALESDTSADVAGIHFVNFFALVSVHLQQAP